MKKVRFSTRIEDKQWRRTPPAICSIFYDVKKRGRFSFVFISLPLKQCVHVYFTLYKRL